MLTKPLSSHENKTDKNTEQHKTKEEESNKAKYDRKKTKCTKTQSKRNNYTHLRHKGFQLCISGHSVEKTR